MKVRAVAVSVVASLVAFSGGCTSTSEHFLGAEVGGGPVLVAEAGADDTPDGASILTSYCPSSACPAGLTTCPSSLFPCDIDLRTDPSNCGTCGFACPEKALGALFSCVDGACVLTCDSGFPPPLDCDGLVDNGCEVTPTTDEDCGGCGQKCLDPANFCVFRTSFAFGCGCGGSDLYCNGRCVDPKMDDRNCGDCDIVCDRAEGPPRPNAYYGCFDRKCGHLKCDDGYADCNGNVVDGCETALLSRDNCGTCGEVCPPDQECLPNVQRIPKCMCPPDKTACMVGLAAWACVDTTSDPEHCGGCGFACPGERPGMSPICKYGSCSTSCAEGTADCNGNIDDGCEVNTNSDPRNCGGCEITCDAVAGQACVGGRCVIEPCEESGGRAR